MVQPEGGAIEARRHRVGRGDPHDGVMATVAVPLTSRRVGTARQSSQLAREEKSLGTERRLYEPAHNK